ncbi:MAG: type II toxin-antitoxin system VapC family toxin [Candidatus Eremiobacteraeota bacterium]|nr:type II toxin-antitoxin system VapC family toxin [Candidatus Eremiobacteraeota bacterium]
MFLLDTNICIPYLNGTDESLKVRFREVSLSGLRLCSVVQAELLFGARKSDRVFENLRRLESLFSLLPSFPFGEAAAHHYGVIRTQLEKDGTPIGGNDLMIAAIALNENATLVTRNIKEFGRVAGLKVVEW